MNLFKFSFKLIVILFFVLAFSFNANSQKLELYQGDIVDKIVAIVGKEVILQSDIDAFLLDAMNKGEKVDLNDKETRQRLLNEMINNKLLVTKAEEDSIQVGDEMVEERYNMALQQLINMYGSIERIEALSKKSISRIKYEYKDEIKKHLMSETLIQQKISEVNLSTKEVENYYAKLQDSLPEIPEQIEIYHLYKTIEPNSDAKNNTIALAKSVRDSIVNGADFGQMATKYSEDPGSKANNGELGWVEKGKFVAEFERAAVNMQIDEISAPVESPFGYHIIKLIAKNKDSINTAHILFKLIQSEDDINKVKTLLDSLKNVAQANNNFEELARELSDDKNTKGFGGLIGKITLADTKSLFAPVADLKDGEISAPFPYSIDPTKQGMHIIWRKKTIPAHKPTLETDYDFIKKVATNYKMFELRNQFVTKLKDEIYWEVFE